LIQEKELGVLWLRDSASITPNNARQYGRARPPYNKVAELAMAKIGMANVSIDLVNLRRVLPSAPPVPRLNIQDVLEDVCLQNSDAAFMDRFTAIAALLLKM
jgi:hypothetical protein